MEDPQRGWSRPIYAPLATDPISGVNTKLSMHQSRLMPWPSDAIRLPMASLLHNVLFLERRKISQILPSYVFNLWNIAFLLGFVEPPSYGDVDHIPQWWDSYGIPVSFTYIRVFLFRINCSRAIDKPENLKNFSSVIFGLEIEKFPLNIKFFIYIR